MPNFQINDFADRAEACRAAGHWTGQLLTDHLDHWAAYNPDKIAIVDARGSITFSELQARSLQCASAMLKMGVAAGDVVSLQLPNWIEWTILHLAATRIGAITNPVVTIFREREMVDVLSIAETSLLITPAIYRNFDYGSQARQLMERVPSIRNVVTIGGPDEPSANSWQAFIAQGDTDLSPASFEGSRPDPDSVTELVFTSGTTGSAKGVLHTHNTLGAPVRAISDRLDLGTDDVFHMASTFGHQTGFLGGIRVPLTLGSTAVYQDLWDPAQFLQLVERYGITMSSGAPTFLSDVLNCPELHHHDASSLRIFRCGGAPIPRAMVRNAREQLPNMHVYSTWGQSENGFVTMTRPGDSIEKLLSTDGCAQAGMEVRVVDGAGQVLPANIEGALQCRGPFLFVGYAKQPDLTRASYQEGWFKTGDMAVMDEEGYIRIVGRDRDLIIRGGENIPVAYVENALYEDRRIADVAIIGMPHERLGEVGCAFVCVRDGADYSMEAMQLHLAAAGVAKQYWPERLVIIEAMPRSANGKIRKIDLKPLLP